MLQKLLLTLGTLKCGKTHLILKYTTFNKNFQGFLTKYEQQLQQQLRNLYYSILLKMRFNAPSVKGPTHIQQQQGYRKKNRTRNNFHICTQKGTFHTQALWNVTSRKSMVQQQHQTQKKEIIHFKMVVNWKLTSCRQRVHIIIIRNSNSKM